MFLLQEMEGKLSDPNFTNHKLINVTAGCPRVCDNVMRDRIMAIQQKLRPLDRAVLCRLVYNQDLVPHIPFHLAHHNFVHLDKLVYITDTGQVIVNPCLEHSSHFAEVKEVFRNFHDALEDLKKRKTEKLREEQPQKTAFEIECETTPEPIKDHMPYWYLTFLEKLKARVDAGHV